MLWYSQNNQTKTIDGTQSQTCTSEASLVHPHMASELSAVTRTRSAGTESASETGEQILQFYEGNTKTVTKFLVTLVV